MKDINLHDIKPIMEVDENSLYYLLGISFFVFLLACGIIYLLYKYIKNKNRFNIRKEHYKLLCAVDTTDTKKAAYAITLYGYTFRDDSPRHTEMFSNLLRKLEPFKYKKEVKPFDDETLSYFELYKEMCHV